MPGGPVDLGTRHSALGTRLGAVGEDGFGGGGGVGFVGADDAAGAAFDPAGDIEAGGDAAAFVGDGAGLFVEGEAFDWGAFVADRAEDEADRDRFEFAGGGGGEGAVLFDQAVLGQADGGDAAVAVGDQFGGRNEKPEGEALRFAGGGALGELGQDFDLSVEAGVRVGGNLRGRERVERHLVRQGDGVGQVHFAEFLDLRGRERGLGGPASA